MKEPKQLSKPMKIALLSSFSFLIIVILLGTLFGNSKEIQEEQNKQTKTKEVANKDIEALNNWINNDYQKEQEDKYKAEGHEYFGTPEYIKTIAFKGFTEENGELTAIVNNNQIKAENLTQKEVANFAFNVILPDYKGKLPKFKNTNNDGSLNDDVLKNPQRYSTLN